MALYQYDRGALFYNSSCLAEWQEGTVDFPGVHEAVETMAKGGTIRGFVRSEARGMNASFTIRIRHDGTEWQDIVDDWNSGGTVMVSVWIGGIQFSSEGKIDLGTVDLKAGTAEVNFKGARPDIL
jgi:hypothetical protein